MPVHLWERKRYAVGRREYADNTKLNCGLILEEAVLLKYHCVLAVIRIGCFGRRKFNVTLQLSLFSSLSAEVAVRLADDFEMEAKLLYGA
jgi:hypothetical protein